MILHDVIEARLLRRYKRFLADHELPGGKVVTAHLANPGSMKSLVQEGGRVWLQANNDPRRKLRYSLQVLAVNEALVCVNTLMANKLVHEALQAVKIKELAGMQNMKTEVKVGESRLDFVLQEPGCHYLEVKSVTLVEAERPGVAMFPDSVSKRGAKHMNELAALVQKGHKASVLYLVNRTDCQSFEVAHHIDRGYARAHQAARAGGVSTLVYGVSIKLQKSAIEILVDRPLPETRFSV